MLYSISVANKLYFRGKNTKEQCFHHSIHSKQSISLILKWPTVESWELSSSLYPMKILQKLSELKYSKLYYRGRIKQSNGLCISGQLLLMVIFNIFQHVFFGIHTQANFTGNELSEHAKSLSDVRWCLMNLQVMKEKWNEIYLSCSSDTIEEKKAIFIFISPLCIFFFIKNVCLPRPFVLKCHHHVVFTVLYITSAAPGTWTKVPASLVDQFLTHMLNNKKKKKAWLLTFFLKWCIYAVLFAYWCAQSHWHLLLGSHSF